MPLKKFNKTHDSKMCVYIRSKVKAANTNIWGEMQILKVSSLKFDFLYGTIFFLNTSKSFTYNVKTKFNEDEKF